MKTIFLCFHLFYFWFLCWFFFFFFFFLNVLVKYRSDTVVLMLSIG